MPYTTKVSKCLLLKIGGFSNIQFRTFWLSVSVLCQNQNTSFGRTLGHLNEASEPTSLFIIFTPRIKASLSHTALESVRSGTAVKKIRSSASLASAKKLQNQENKSDLLKSNSALKVQRGSSSTSKLPPPVPFKMDTSR